MERRSIHFGGRHLEIVDKMEENGDADNASEAVRDAIEHYGQELGYTNGEKRDTYLRWLFGRMAWAFIYVGVGAVAVLYFLPIGFRLAAVGPFLGGLVCLVAERVLAAHEPQVTNSLKGLLGGEKA